MFLPSTPQELIELGIAKLDIILVTGDAYIDSPFSGTALVGKTLLSAGFTVGVIAQPDINSEKDILRLGTPTLFWGVNAGATDSLVANYTSSEKKRRSCDFTPGGVNDRRPDRATIVYTNLIKRFDKTKRPVVLGGIEASLRRLAHYDLLTDKIRKPLLFDAKADYLIYGMGEITAVRLAYVLSGGAPALPEKLSCIFGTLSDLNAKNIPGTVYISGTFPKDADELPSFEACETDPEVFHSYFDLFYRAASSMSNKVTVQQCMGRWAVQNPPFVMNSKQLDYIHGLDFEREVHPYDRKKGEVKACHVVKTSIPTHRGCYGECSFCAISVHQGRAVVSRSHESVLNEAGYLVSKPWFKGIISDVGGATANMYRTECAAMKAGKPCGHKSCLEPDVCPSLRHSQKEYLDLLRRLRKIPGVKKVLVASGIRCDLVMADIKNAGDFIEELAGYHTGGQIKLAPEHVDPQVLKLMGKTDFKSFEEFSVKFLEISSKMNMRQYITCYFMAAHPGCTDKSMKILSRYIQGNLGFTPEQVQIFTPTPSTWSTCMYHAGMDKNGRRIFAARSLSEKLKQKYMISHKDKKV